MHKAFVNSWNWKADKEKRSYWIIDRGKWSIITKWQSGIWLTHYDGECETDELYLYSMSEFVGTGKKVMKE